MMILLKPMTKQRGNILVMFTIGLFVLIAMSALALDGGHLLLNKTRLQNLVDAAALHGAIVLDKGGNHQAARAAVVDILTYNLNHNDNREIQTALDLSDADDTLNQITPDLLVQFSEKPDPFIDSSVEDYKYVLVTVSNLSLSNFFANLFNFNKRVSASAVAGASTAFDFCFDDLVPMMVCGTPPSPSSPSQTGYLFGFEPGEIQIMKMDSDPNSEIGPGNFQLIRLGDSKGANDVKYAMAGEESGSNACFSTGEDNASVPTEPGNTVGPVAQGLNTRMGIYDGSMKNFEDVYRRDVNTCEGPRIELDDDGKAFVYAEDNVTKIYPGVIPDTSALSEAEKEVVLNTYFTTDPFYSKIYTFGDYKAGNTSFINSGNDVGICPTAGETITQGDFVNESISAEPLRREIRVVVGDCTGENGGATDVDFLGVGCFYLSQHTKHTGPESYVAGEFHSNCSGLGKPSGTASQNTGPYKIVLFHAPNSSGS